MFVIKFIIDSRCCYRFLFQFEIFAGLFFYLFDLINEIFNLI